MISLSQLASRICWKPKPLCTGTLCAVKGSVVSARLPFAALGDLCFIERRSKPDLAAQVVSFCEDLCCLAPLDTLDGVSPGALVRDSGNPAQAVLYGDPRGKVLDALGVEISAGKRGEAEICLPLNPLPPRPLERSSIKKQLVTGLRSIDGICPIGYGQRMGIFAGAGVGKSTLLGMIARHAKVDISVIALAGERGREVQDFIHNCLGNDGLSRSVVVVATSDESPLRRMLAPKTATAIAEYYRDQGLNVLLLVDSLTRTARAIREVELSAGEIPVRQGYTAGVYTELPKLLERAGTNARGSISALYTILTAGEDEHDALADEIKSILDGHLVLDSRLAQQGIRPAIDSLASVSRLSEALFTPTQRLNAGTLISLLARLRRDRDILLLGGTPDTELKAALELEPELRALFTQTPEHCSQIAETFQSIAGIAERFRSLRAAGAHAHS